MLPGRFEAGARQPLDGAHKGLFRRAFEVGEQALIGTSIVLLWVGLFPVAYFIAIHPDGTVVDPRFEALQVGARVVDVPAGLVAVGRAVQRAAKLPVRHPPVREQGTAMPAASIENRYIVALLGANDDEIDIGRQGIRRFHWFEFGPFNDSEFVHCRFSRCGPGRLAEPSSPADSWRTDSPPILS